MKVGLSKAVFLDGQRTFAALAVPRPAAGEMRTFGTTVQDVDTVGLHWEDAGSVSGIKQWGVNLPLKQEPCPRLSTKLTSSAGLALLRPLVRDISCSGNSDAAENSTQGKDAKEHSQSQFALGMEAEHNLMQPLGPARIAGGKNLDGGAEQTCSAGLPSARAKAEQAHRGIQVVLGDPGLPMPESPAAVAALAAARTEWLGRLKHLVGKVAEHYGVPMCVLALEHGEELAVPAHYGPSLQPEGRSAHGSRRACSKQFVSERTGRRSVERPRQVERGRYATHPQASARPQKCDFALFRHRIARDLPIIINDAQEDKRLATEPLVTGTPHLRFYAAAPLLCGRWDGLSSRPGTLSIADTKANAGFSLEDTLFLQEKAAEVVELFRIAGMCMHRVHEALAKN